MPTIKHESSCVFIIIVFAFTILFILTTRFDIYTTTTISGVTVASSPNIQYKQDNEHRSSSLQIYKRGFGMIILNDTQTFENRVDSIVDAVQCMPLEEIDGKKYRPKNFDKDKLINYNARNVLKAPDVHTVAEYALVDYTKHKVQFRMPYLQPESKQMACAYPKQMERFFFVCENKVPEHFPDIPPIYNWLWHNETTPTLLQYADCAFIDFGSGHAEVLASVYTEKGYVHHPGYLNLKSDDEILEYKELGTAGSNHYPNAFGHWPQEILPKLMFLWITLPQNIPLLWPEGMKKVYYHFIKRKIINQSDRAPVIFETRKTYYAKRVWFLNSAEVQGYTIDNYVYWRHLQRIYINYFKKEKPKETILVINRNKSASSRHFTNMDQLLERIRHKFGSKYEIDEFIKAPSFIDGGNRYYHARIVIGAHGAGLSYQLFMRPGTSTIEVGPLSNDMPLPSMYYALAKALDIHYSLVLTHGNIYNGDLTVNIDEIIRSIEYTITKMKEEGYKEI